MTNFNFILLKDVAKVCVALDEAMSQCATSYHKRQCRSFKAAVLLPYQVLPDVIVSNTPHAVVVYYYHNGWSRD